MMQTATPQTEPGAGRITGPLAVETRKGFTLTTFMVKGNDFRVEVAHEGREGLGEAVQTFRDENRGRAERLAEEWIDAQGAPANEPTIIVAPIVVKGWRLEASVDARGDHHVMLCPHVGVDGAPPEAEEFAGYQYRDIALRDASAWCDAHPLRVDGESPGGFAWWASWYGGESAQGYRYTVIHAAQVCGALIEGVHVFATADECCAAAETWCAAYKPGEPPPPEVPEPAVAPVEGGTEGVDAVEAVAPPVPPTTPTPTPTPTAAPPSPGAAKDFEETTSAAEQYWSIGQEIAEKENELEALKAELKSLIKQRDLRALKMSNGLRAMRDGRSAGPYQVRLPIEQLPIEQAKVAVEAPKVVAELKGVPEGPEGPEGPEVPWASVLLFFFAMICSYAMPRASSSAAS